MRPLVALTASATCPIRFWSCCDCSCSIRRSAISCWCSLLAASAGVVVARTSARIARPASETFCFIVHSGGPCPQDSSLRRHDEMRAAVLRPRRLVVPGVERELLAVAHRTKPVGGDAERHEIGARGDRPAFAQRQIVLGRAAFVAMAFDRDGPASVSLQQGGIVVENLLPLR